MRRNTPKTTTTASPKYVAAERLCEKPSKNASFVVFAANATKAMQCISAASHIGLGSNR
jgi:hypothetical protein